MKEELQNLVLENLDKLTSFVDSEFDLLKLTDEEKFELLEVINESLFTIQVNFKTIGQTVDTGLQLNFNFNNNKR